jgi:hypothetical protein
MLAQPGHRAVSIPSQVFKQFQGMAAYRVAKQFRLGFQPLPEELEAMSRAGGFDDFGLTRTPPSLTPSMKTAIWIIMALAFLHLAKEVLLARRMIRAFTSNTGLHKVET